MNTKEEIKLNYPEEFRIACKINNLRHEELVQYFIDHVSFYAFIGGDMEAPYLWATTVSTNCKSFNGNEVQIIKDPEIQAISLKYVKKLTAINLDRTLTIQKETFKSISLMKQWAVEMTPLTNYQLNLRTTNGEVFKLSFDFNLLCRMNGIDITTLLQYFIDHVSLAKERAQNIIKTVKTDPSTAVLLLLVSSHEKIRNKILPQQDVYKQFCLKILKVDRLQREERSLEARIRNYTQFYREWYNALNKNIN